MPPAPAASDGPDPPSTSEDVPTIDDPPLTDLDWYVRAVLARIPPLPPDVHEQVQRQLARDTTPPD